MVQPCFSKGVRSTLVGEAVSYNDGLLIIRGAGLCELLPLFCDLPFPPHPINGLCERGGREGGSLVACVVDRSLILF